MTSIIWAARNHTARLIVAAVGRIAVQPQVRSDKGSIHCPIGHRRNCCSYLEWYRYQRTIITSCNGVIKPVIGSETAHALQSIAGSKYTNPIWNQTFQFVVESYDHVLHVSVFDQSLGERYPIGSCQISLMRARACGSDVVRATLMSGSGKTCGVIQVSVRQYRSSAC